MSIIRKVVFFVYSLMNWLLLKINKVEYQSLTIQGIPLIHNKGTIRLTSGKINSSKFKNIIGGDTRSSIVVKKNALLQIGSNFKMSNSAIYCAEKIIIGDNVMIGGSCRIWDTDFHPLNSALRASNPNEEYVTRPVHIGSDVFIGGFSIILKGVMIGDGAIIGAGSVVSKNIPSGEIWAGNPATFIKKADHGHTEAI